MPFHWGAGNFAFFVPPCTPADPQSDEINALLERERVELEAGRVTSLARIARLAQKRRCEPKLVGARHSLRNANSG